MLLWISLVALCLVVVLVLLLPLRHEASASLQASDADMAVYRDQLGEIDADLDRGLIGADQADAARTEIARRLLSEHDEGKEPPETDAATPRPFPRATAVAMAVMVPVAGFAFYFHAGSPSLPSQPLAERQSKDLKKATGFELIKRVEARLQKQPNDGKAWDVLAPIYLQLRRFEDAAEAYRNSIRLLGETPGRLIGYIQARIEADNGVITDDTLKAIEHAGEVSPERPEPKFWRALAKEQDGDLSGAEAAYQVMIESAKPDDAWVGMVQGRLDGLKKKLKPQK